MRGDELTNAMSTYLFALVDAGGSVPPELGCVRRLVERGHRVEVLAEDSMREEIVDVGARFRPWRAINRPDRKAEHDPLHDWDTRGPREFIARMLDAVLVGPAPQMAADLTNTLRDGRPDVVVCSFLTLGAMVAAEAAHLTYFVLMPNVYGLPAPGMPPFGLGVAPATGAFTKLRDRTVNVMVRQQWNRGLGRFNQLRKTRGLPPIGDLWDQVRQAAKVLVLTSGRFDFPAQLPDSVRYVGPVLDDPAWAADQPWSPPPGDGPLVLVAMSSTFQNHAEALQRCIEALASLPVRGLVTTGQAIDPSNLRGRDNVYIVSAAPHSEVFKHASAVVTHGGHGTVARGLAAGVPLVVMPHGRDQGDNAVRVASRGAGVTVGKNAAPTKIADAVQRVLANDGYQRAAMQLGEVMRRDAASGALLTELEDLPPYPGRTSPASVADPRPEQGC